MEILVIHQQICGKVLMKGQATSKFGVGKLVLRLHLTIASSLSASFDSHRFRSPYHQSLFKEHVASKSVTPEIRFHLQEDQHPEIKEQIAGRRWKRLTNPRTKISKLLIQEFYANAVRTEEEIAEAEVHPYKSYVRGVEINFSAEKIKQIMRIRDHTPGAESDFDTHQRSDQRFDEVIQEICVPGARWKMSSSQPHQPIQLKRQDLIPLARGWHEFIIHSIIPTGNKSEIIVARAILIHSITKRDDVRAEELIADNIVITAEQPQGRSKLIFSSSIYSLCKKAEVPLREFRGSELIPVDKLITARVMVRTRADKLTTTKINKWRKKKNKYSNQRMKMKLSMKIKQRKNNQLCILKPPMQVFRTLGNNNNKDSNNSMKSFQT
ncbi:hypothetical protein PIB30_068299 [Stylosanthes scabra]|uniref:Putative plant transposon protein domain-containing protein n=1 Tax=Stylosanthes scabra TaxID=79078 RepID=A0ABU6WL41_9FABA|nr:hypothetical protein [Stylosanthes scabra]